MGLKNLREVKKNECIKSKGAKYKAIGNGWTVDVIAHIFRGLNDESN